MGVHVVGGWMTAAWKNVRFFLVSVSIFLSNVFSLPMPSLRGRACVSLSSGSSRSLAVGSLIKYAETATVVTHRLPTIAQLDTKEWAERVTEAHPEPIALIFVDLRFLVAASSVDSGARLQHLFQQVLGARGVEDGALAALAHDLRGLPGGQPPQLHVLHHLTDEAERDHAVAA